MFLAAGALVHQVHTFDQPAPQRLKVTLLLLGSLIPVSIYHCWTDEIIVHEIAFAAMVFLTGKKTRALLREQIPDKAAREKIVGLTTFGLGEFVFIFYLLIIWDYLGLSGIFSDHMVRWSAILPDYLVDTSRNFFLII